MKARLAHALFAAVFYTVALFALARFSPGLNLFLGGAGYGAPMEAKESKLSDLSKIAALHAAACDAATVGKHKDAKVYIAALSRLLSKLGV